MGIKWRLPYRLCSKLYYFVNIFVNFKIFKKVDHILKSSSDVQSFFLPFMSFINNLKSKTTFKSSLNSHIFWDTMYLVWSFLTFKLSHGDRYFSYIYLLCDASIRKNLLNMTLPKYVASIQIQKVSAYDSGRKK